MAVSFLEEQDWFKRVGRLEGEGEASDKFLLSGRPGGGGYYQVPVYRSSRPVTPAGGISFYLSHVPVTRPYRMSARRLPAQRRGVWSERTYVFPGRRETSEVRRFGGGYDRVQAKWWVPRARAPELPAAWTSFASERRWAGSRHGAKAWGKGAAAGFQAYMERAGSEARRRLEVIADDAGPVSVGNIAGSPAERVRFWREAEAAEAPGGRTQNRLTMEFPHCLSASECRAALLDFAAIFEEQGLRWHAVAHRADPGGLSEGRNLHGHIVYHDRPAEPADGNRPGEAPPGSQPAGDGLKPPEIGWRFAPRKNRDVRGPAWLRGLRERWAEAVNRQLKRAREERGVHLGVPRGAAAPKGRPAALEPGPDRQGRPVFYDPRPYWRMGIDKVPGQHLGARRWRLESAGVPTRVGLANALSELDWRERQLTDAAWLAGYRFAERAMTAGAEVLDSLGGQGAAPRPRAGRAKPGSASPGEGRGGAGPVGRSRVPTLPMPTPGKVRGLAELVISEAEELTRLLERGMDAARRLAEADGAYERLIGRAERRISWVEAELEKLSLRAPGSGAEEGRGRPPGGDPADGPRRGQGPPAPRLEARRRRLEEVRAEALEAVRRQIRDRRAETGVPPRDREPAIRPSPGPDEARDALDRMRPFAREAAGFRSEDVQRLGRIERQRQNLLDALVALDAALVVDRFERARRQRQEAETALSGAGLGMPPVAGSDGARALDRWRRQLAERTEAADRLRPPRDAAVRGLERGLRRYAAEPEAAARGLVEAVERHRPVLAEPLALVKAWAAPVSDAGGPEPWARIGIEAPLPARPELRLDRLPPAEQQHLADLLGRAWRSSRAWRRAERDVAELALSPPDRRLVGPLPEEARAAWRRRLEEQAREELKAASEIMAPKAGDTHSDLLLAGPAMEARSRGLEGLARALVEARARPSSAAGPPAPRPRDRERER